MPYPGQQRRNSLRYPGYDYAQPGSVFVTVCTAGKQCLFGQVVDGEMRHSPAGVEAVRFWQAIPDHFPGVALDVFVVMPDHLHGIIHCGSDPGIASGASSVGSVLRWYKASVVEGFRIGVRHNGWEPYDRHLWQRDYYDRIIRTDTELAAIRAYIEGNPGRWWERMQGQS